jgi:hypothetical protein
MIMRLPTDAFRMIGQTLTMPVGVAHEGTHYLAAALCGCPASIEIERTGSHCRVDFEAASRRQRAVIALAPALVALVIAPLVAALLWPAWGQLAIAALALWLYGAPSAADRRVAAASRTQFELMDSQAMPGDD